jgi:thioredoxin-like negative regulator of GroEL
MIELTQSRDLATHLSDYQATVLYFSTPHCSVCGAMQPKIERLLAKYASPLIHIDAHEHPDLAGQYVVFTSPTLVIVENQRELLRESRFIDLERVERLLDAYHS